MTHPALYTASVPVFLYYLDRIGGLLAKTRTQEAMLDARLAPDMFSCGQQFATAMHITLRAAYPLAGRPVPRTIEGKMDLPGLRARLAATKALLAALDPGEFVGAEARMIDHRAGFAELSQDGATFLHLFGMPNFMFHLGMGFAILRANGAEIGKADFDGLHDYPPGFSF